MGTIFQLIVGIGLVSALAFGVNSFWTSFKEGIAAPYVQAQIEADQPKINAANSERDDAVKRADNAQQDTAACKSASETQSAKVRDWEAKAISRAEEVKKLRAASAQSDQTRQSEIQRYQAIAAGAQVTGQSCEQKLADLDKLARDAARSRAAAAKTKAGAQK